MTAPPHTASSSSGAPGLTRYYGDIATFGGEASGGDRTAILAAMHRYMSAIATGDWTAACGQLSTPIQHQLRALLSHSGALRGRGCATALGVLLGRSSQTFKTQLARLHVIAVRSNGTRAFVLYRSVQAPHAMISMLRETGEWKAGVLSGVGLP